MRMEEAQKRRMKKLNYIKNIPFCTIKMLL